MDGLLFCNARLVKPSVCKYQAYVHTAVGDPSFVLGAIIACTSRSSHCARATRSDADPGASVPPRDSPVTLQP